MQARSLKITRKTVEDWNPKKIWPFSCKQQVKDIELNLDKLHSPQTLVSKLIFHPS